MDPGQIPGCMSTFQHLSFLVLSILLETMVVVLHLGFVTVVTGAVSGGGGGGSYVFIRANCTDI